MLMVIRFPYVLASKYFKVIMKEFEMIQIPETSPLTLEFPQNSHKLLRARKLNDLYKIVSKKACGIEMAVRIGLMVFFIVTEYLEPFRRRIDDEEWWLYRNPRKPSYVPSAVIWILAAVMPTFGIGLYYFWKRNILDVLAGILAVSLGLLINGLITNMVKLTYGRPRPDFFYRCFANGEKRPVYAENGLPQCSGNFRDINDGLKSFPSGHSSFAFMIMTFLSLYWAGKLRTFSAPGPGSAPKLLAFLCPLAVAALIAISRTADYHHHYQDVLAGSCLGAAIAWLTYRQQYPGLSSPYSHLPLSALGALGEHPGTPLPPGNGLQSGARIHSYSDLSSLNKAVGSRIV